MTIIDVKKIWLRDKAELLRQPSIDRINPDGNYIAENIRFVELGENSSGHRITDEFRQMASRHMTEYNKRRKIYAMSKLQK